jgi:hypothetical protein
MALVVINTIAMNERLGICHCLVIYCILNPNANSLPGTPVVSAGVVDSTDILVVPGRRGQRERKRER